MKIDKIISDSKEITNNISCNRSSFNSALIKENIREANETASKNIASAMNLVADNVLSSSYVLKDAKVREYTTLSRNGFTSIVRKIHPQDRTFAIENGFDGITNDGTIFKVDRFSAEGYDLDHILPYEFLLAKENEDLLSDIIISYNGDIETAFDDLMTRNSKNFLFASAHVNRSKGSNLGSSENCKYSKLTDSQKEAIRNAYKEREATAIKEATKNTEANKVKGKMDQLKNTLKTMIIVAVIKIGIRIVLNKIMEITGELMMKDYNKKWTQVLKDTCGKDAIKKKCLSFYEKLKNIKDSFPEYIRNTIELFKNGKEFAKKLANTALRLLAKLSVVALETLFGNFKLVGKAIQLGWSAANLAKEIIKTLKTKISNNENYVARLNNAKNLVKDIIRLICDGIDFAIELVIAIYFAGVNIYAWVRPLVNIVLNTLCTILAFSITMFIDVVDTLMVNASQRVKYVAKKIFS